MWGRFGVVEPYSTSLKHCTTEGEKTEWEISHEFGVVQSVPLKDTSAGIIMCKW